jgi:S1/P1 nuclease
MRKSCLIPIIIAIGFLWSDRASAWGPEGHAAIASLAERLLAPNTEAAVHDLLTQGGDKDLVSVASWADLVLSAAHGEGPLRESLEAAEFNQTFPKSAIWHYVNIPLGARSYEDARNFVDGENVIHAIERCVRVLESSAPPKDLTKVQALRLLVHFVGDIHQPLHCGTGFYCFPDPETAHLITVPAEAFGKPSDRGGNLLFYDSSPIDQLHALWDRVLVENIDHNFDYRILADYLRRNYLPKETQITSGDYHQWASAWAIDSVKVANLAYDGIKFGAAEFDANQRLTSITVTLPTDYIEVNRARAAQQLAKAAVHLAQLLNAIQWK